MFAFLPLPHLSSALPMLLTSTLINRQLHHCLCWEECLLWASSHRTWILLPSSWILDSWQLSIHEFYNVRGSRASAWSSYTPNLDCIILHSLWRIFLRGGRVLPTGQRRNWSSRRAAAAVMVTVRGRQLVVVEFLLSDFRWFVGRGRLA